MNRIYNQILKDVMLSPAISGTKHLAVQQRDSSPSVQNDNYKTFFGLARMSSNILRGKIFVGPVPVPDIRKVTRSKE